MSNPSIPFSMILRSKVRTGDIICLSDPTLYNNNPNKYLVLEEPTELAKEYSNKVNAFWAWNFKEQRKRRIIILDPCGEVWLLARS